LKDSLQQLVERFENDATLLDPHHLRARLDALDRLDAILPYAPPVSESFTTRAQKLASRFEAINADLYKTIRDDIRSDALPESLLRWVSPSPESVEPSTALGYDFLDELLSGVLQLEPPDDTQVGREAELVFYQPTPARHIFHLIGLLALTEADVFVDLGSGLGQVSLLVSICTSATCTGIELETAYVDRARQCAEDLNLKNVAFLRQDARAADLSRGTVFYLYTPFTGSVLAHMLDRLSNEAANRPIRICSYGPCTSVIAKEPWLETASSPHPDRITIFHSRD
jgi:hypothetical protein